MQLGIAERHALEPASQVATIVPFTSFHLGAMQNLVDAENNTSATRGVPVYSRGSSGAAWFKRLLHAREAGRAGIYAVLSTASASLVGTVRFSGPIREGSCLLSYWIAQAVRNRGFATSAGEQVIRRLYQIYGQSFLIGTFADACNHASMRVLHKLGFVESGPPAGVYRSYLHRRSDY